MRGAKICNYPTAQLTKLAHDSYRMSEMCWETLDICYQTVILIENLASFHLPTRCKLQPNGNQPPAPQ